MRFPYVALACPLMRGKDYTPIYIKSEIQVEPPLRISSPKYLQPSALFF